MANITIQQVRQQYPDYEDLSDQELADKLHSKFYSDMPQDEFYEKVGLNEIPFEKEKNNWEQAREQHRASGDWHTLSNEPVVNAILGAGDALQHNIANVAELLPGVNNLPRAKSSEGTAYDIGDLAGNMAAYLGGGEVLGAARLGAEGLPMIGKAAQLLGKTPAAISRMTGSSAYGALTNTEDRRKGALEGAAFGLAGEVIPYLGKAIFSRIKSGTPLLEGLSNYLPSKLESLENIVPSKPEESRGILDKLFPGRIANRLEEKSNNLLLQAEKHEEEIPQLTQKLSEQLGKGAKTTEEVSPSIAADVRKLHDAREANAGIYFKHVLGQVNKTKDNGLLYKQSDPLINTALTEGRELMSQIDDLKVGPLFEKFRKNPTFENAHNLQQELGLMIGDLKKIPARSAEERLQLGNLRDAREKLKNDMTGYLENKYPNQNENLSSQWQKGIDLYREEVEPLLSNRKLREINRGRKNYVKNIHTAFEHPEASDLISREGERIPGSASKLHDMLSQETKDKILFSKIGAHSGKNANQFLNALDRANRQGYSKHISPTLKQGVKEALSKQEQANLLKEESKELYPKIEELKEEHKFRTGLYKYLGGGLGAGATFGLGAHLGSKYLL